MNSLSPENMMNNKVLIIKIATKLLSEHGTVQFSINQVADTCQLNIKQVTNHFSNKNDMIGACLRRAIDCLSITITNENYTKGHTNALHLWQLLVQYNFVYVAEGKLISLYLKSPSQFPHMNIKSELLPILKSKTEVLNDRFFNSCDAIRMIAVSYLIEMATFYTLAQDAEGTRELRENYFAKYVKAHFDTLLTLPIY